MCWCSRRRCTTGRIAAPSPAASPSCSCRRSPSSAAERCCIRWVSALLLCLLAGHAGAQADYPSRPVRIIVPSPPSGGTDIVARVLAQPFSKAFGQQFIVENKPGAGNMIGIEAAARSPADGYTLLMVASTLVLNSVLYRQVPYDPVDFAPIPLAAAPPDHLVVDPKLPIHSV